MLPSDIQRWDPTQYNTTARFVSDLGMPVLTLLAPQPGERILDLGCGDGALTAKLAALGCSVVGVDASPEMIAAAQALGLDARVMDGQALTFDGAFDAVFSNAALHWMPDAEAVIDGVWRALVPGGRFVGEFGGHGNVAAIAAALAEGLLARGYAVPSPWYYPRPAEHRKLLEARGFEVLSIALIPRPTPLPAGMLAWLETFAGPFSGSLLPNERGAYLNEVVEALRPTLCDAEGHWHADYVRLRFAAQRPEPEKS